MVRYRNVILSPWVLSILPFLLVVLLIHNDFKRYLFEAEESFVLAENEYYTYNDIDGDGYSEMIITKSSGGFTSLGIYGKNGIIDQWNFRGDLSFQFRKCIFLSGDSDNDGSKELYIFTLSSDSVFLHCIHDLKNTGPVLSERLLSVSGRGDNTPDPFIIPAEMEDLDGDGIMELIFGIGSGFSKYPRNVFAYYISNDSLAISPESYYYIWKILQTDMTGDGINEIIPFGYATSNVSPEVAEYHDCSAHLMVLDRKLQFLFEPVRMGGRFSKMTPAGSLHVKDTTLAFLYNPASSKALSTVYYADVYGRLTDSVKLPYYAIDFYKTSFRRKEMYLLFIPGRGLALVNDKLEIQKIAENETDFEIFQDDFDMDGRKEIMLYTIKTGLLTVYREGLLHPVELKIPSGENSDFLMTIKDEGNSGRLVSIQSGRDHYLLKYGKNPLYPFSYLIYLLVYSGFAGFTFLVKKLQENQTKRKFETEKKISELQMALVRNQLDPHFTLNAINSVIYSVEHSSAEKAGLHLRQFAGLYRNLLLSADTTRRSIGDELEFCRDYLELEQMRFIGKFEYKIITEVDIDPSFLIPKMLIQIHVENAIKHGLAQLKSGGLLIVKVEKEGGTLVISVTDNGIGREASAGIQLLSTGKGLKIMDELYKVYGKYYNETIGSEIQDLYGSDGSPAGTRVIIKIVRRNE